MQVTLTIRRQGPEPGAVAAPQGYAVSVEEGATVLDAMLQVRDRQDPSLAFRAECLRGFCGACAARVNGEGVLACMTPVAKIARQGEVRVEPLRHVGVLKDLVYDMDAFLWQKVKAVTPWVDSGEGKPAPDRVMDPAVAEDLQTVMSCVMCGLCDEGCTVIAVDKTFLGPAALTKAYRAVRDSRDTHVQERLRLLERPHGIWDCTHCFEANGHCPKGIAPTDRIFAMREMVMKQGIGNKAVARHHDSMAASVKSSGWVDEGRLAVESEGWLNVPRLLTLLPTGLKALRRGKGNLPYLHKKRPGAQRIRRIFEKVERSRQ